MEVDYKVINNNNIFIRETATKISRTFNFNKLQENALLNILYETTRNIEITIKFDEIGSFESFIEIYLDAKRLEGYSSETLKNKKYNLLSLNNFINKKINSITVADLKMYLLSKGYKSSTANTVIALIKSFFTFLHEEGYIDNNPSSRLKKVKEEKRLKKAVNDVDFEKIRSACNNKRDRAFVEFAYATGLRVSELVSLNRDSLDYYSNTLKVIGKGNKERLVMFSDISKYYLLEYLNSREDDNPALFVSLRKPYSRLSRRGIAKILERIKKELGMDIDLSPHILRHTFATKLAETADITVVQKLLGHENINTTMVYAEVNKDKLSFQYKNSKL